MRVDVVKGNLSKLAGRKCRHCPRAVRTGDVVLWAKLPNVEWGDDLFVVHASCMAGLLESAPEGTPEATAGDRRNERRRLRATARRRAVEALCTEQAERLADLEENELAVAALDGRW